MLKERQRLLALQVSWSGPHQAGQTVRGPVGPPFQYPRLPVMAVSQGGDPCISCSPASENGRPTQPNSILRDLFGGDPCFEIHLLRTELCSDCFWQLQLKLPLGKTWTFHSIRLGTGVSLFPLRLSPHHLAASNSKTFHVSFLG